MMKDAAATPSWYTAEGRPAHSGRPLSSAPTMDVTVADARNPVELSAWPANSVHVIFRATRTVAAV